MGEAKKLRRCPAVSREITAADCGENRLSRWACPETCSHNPFAVTAYSALLEIENRLDLTTVKRLAAEDLKARDAIIAASRAKSVHAMNAVSVWHLFFKRGGNDRTFAERWEGVGFAGLRNDERVLFRGKMKMRVALIEVHRVIDAQRVEVVDLLDEAQSPFVIVDRSFAARVPRFFTGLTWIYPLPHFWRLSGTAIDVAELGPWPGREIIDACVAHLGGPAEPAGRLRWLAENFVRMGEALTAVGHARRRLTFAAVDGAWGTSTYTLRMPFAAAVRRLREDSDVVPESVTADQRAQGFTQGFTWFESSLKESAGRTEALGGRLVLGRVLVGKNEWRLEAMGKARLQDFRRRFERRMGDAVQFSRERIDNLAGQMTAGEPTGDLALVPPSLLEQPDQFVLATSRIEKPQAEVPEVSTLLAEARRAWLDSAVPMFDGRTPREAARDSALRGKLIELIKKQVRRIDRDNLAHRGSEDANALIRELGLTEIDFPPPPPRDSIPDEDSGDDEFDPADDSGSAGREEESGARPRAPWMVGAPFDIDTAMKRIDSAMQQFDRAADALDELDASGATLVDDLEEMTRGLFVRNEFDFLVTFLIEVWFVFVPVGARAPEINVDAMAAEIDALSDQIGKGGPEAANLLQKLPEISRQPGLLTVIMGQLLAGAESMPKKARPTAEGLVSALVVLKALIDELDRALRPPPGRQ
jgi:hypothetical protein